MRASMLCLLTACGRISFDATTVDSDAQSPTGDGGNGFIDTFELDGLGTDVAQGGLALDLDPGDTESYPGSGTTVFDKSGKNNHGTIAGTVAFVSAGAGSYFTFDGADTSFITLGTPSPAGWVFGTQARTLSGWAYATILRVGYNVFFSYGNGVNGEGNYLGTDNGNGMWNFGGFFINQVGGSSLAGQWVQLTGVWDGTTAHLYINGALASESAQPLWNAMPGGDAKVGVDTEFAGEGWLGRVGRVLYYNRALDAAEVVHNFEITRARYGL